MYQKLIKKLTMFREAAYDLLEEMEKYDDELLADDYPFHKSFDEIAQDIAIWVEMSEEKLKRQSMQKK